MAALQFCEWPDYSAVLFRRTFKELSSNDGLLPLCQEWLAPTDAVGAETLGGYPTRYDFPSGAVLSFSHMAVANDRYQHKGARYDFAGFDELTGFLEVMYTYVFSRLRKSKDSWIPTRMRAATNPGDIGHQWVMDRFRIPGKPQRRMKKLQIRQADGEITHRCYLPSHLIDNPTMDATQYRRSLHELGPIDQARMEYGDWSAREMGDMFKREWFDVVPEAPSDTRKHVRRWDLAATKKTKDNHPDWTAGVLMSTKGRGPEQEWFIHDVQRFQEDTAGRDVRIRQCAESDGRSVTVSFPQDPGQAGKSQIVGLKRLLHGFRVPEAKGETGSKEIRAGTMATSASIGKVHLVEGQWMNAFLEELDAFPSPGVPDDQVDAAAGAYNELMQKRAGWGDMGYKGAKEVEEHDEWEAA